MCYVSENILGWSSLETHQYSLLYPFTCRPDECDKFQKINWTGAVWPCSSIHVCTFLPAVHTVLKRNIRRLSIPMCTHTSHKEVVIYLFVKSIVHYCPVYMWQLCRLCFIYSCKYYVTVAMRLIWAQHSTKQAIWCRSWWWPSGRSLT
jgi:hypothetical protein